MGHQFLPQSDAWSASLPPVNGGPGLRQRTPWLLPFPGGTKAEPEALWLETKIDLNVEGDRMGGGPLGSGKLRDLGPGVGEPRLRRGRVCLTAQQVCQMDWEGSSGGREDASREAGGAVLRWGCGPSCHAWGRGGANPGREGRGEPPQQPLLW